MIEWVALALALVLSLPGAYTTWRHGPKQGALRALAVGAVACVLACLVIFAWRLVDSPRLGGEQDRSMWSDVFLGTAVFVSFMLLIWLPVQWALVFVAIFGHHRRRMRRIDTQRRRQGGDA